MVPSFLNQPNRLTEHLNDARFRGVYFLLATMLPMGQALRLREQMVQFAAKSNDMSLLRPFVQLLNSRQAA